MTAQEVIATIRAEIERRIKILREDEVVRQNCTSDFLEGKIYGYEEIISFLSTLESEKPTNQGLDKEIDEISIHVPCSEFTHESEYIDLLDWLKEQFTYFYELGKRSNSSEKPIDQDELEKEIERCLWQLSDDPSNEELYMFARHFAQWGAEHLKK